MAQVVAPGSSPPQQQSSQHAPHGTKRSADTGLEHEQRLSKRFDLLNLVDNNGTRLYIPVPGSLDPPTTSTTPILTPHPLASTLPLQKRTRPPRPTRPSSSGMEIEDTPHRVYIHDLAAELSDIESDEDTPIFLSDIEKHLSKIPKHVLMGPEPKANENNQMVVYNVPASLSVPEERDGVRKAIVEARRRIREGMGSTVGERERGGRGGVREVRVQQSVPPATVDVDSEAMDLD